MKTETYIVEVRNKDKQFRESTLFKLKKDRKYEIRYDKEIDHFIISESDS